MTSRTVSLDRSSSSFSWWRVGWVFYVFIILALATVPIIGTYPEFSHTADEPAHIAAGMELLDREPSRTNSSIHRSRGLLLLSARIFWARARMARNISSTRSRDPLYERRLPSDEYWQRRVHALDHRASFRPA